MSVGFDLDGTVNRRSFFNPSIWLPRWLFIFVIPFLKIMPRDEIVEIMKKAKEKGESVIIITARPPFVANSTEASLREKNIPVDELICVGFGKGTKQRKLEAIRNAGIVTYYDNDKRLISFLRENDIEAVCIKE